MKIGMIIQARSGSSRLPKKIIKTLPLNSEVSILAHDIRRSQKSKYVDEVIVATTEKEEDDVIETIALAEGALVYRGSEEDVLARHYYAAKEYELEVIVRITSDCPCLDSNLIDAAVEIFLEDTTYDFVGTVLKRTFPIGLDVEVIKFEALEKAFFEATEPYHREHVTDYIFENDTLFKLKNIEASKALNFPDLRLTVDTEQDYLLMCAIFDNFDSNYYFSAEDVIELIKSKPWLKEINKNSSQKKYNLTEEEEVKIGIEMLEFNGLRKAKRLLENLSWRSGNE